MLDHCCTLLQPGCLPLQHLRVLRKYCREIISRYYLTINIVNHCACSCATSLQMSYANHPFFHLERFVIALGPGAHVITAFDSTVQLTHVANIPSWRLWLLYGAFFKFTVFAPLVTHSLYAGIQTMDSLRQMIKHMEFFCSETWRMKCFKLGAVFLVKFRYRTL